MRHLMPVRREVHVAQVQTVFVRRHDAHMRSCPHLGKQHLLGTVQINPEAFRSHCFGGPPDGLTTHVSHSNSEFTVV